MPILVEEDENVLNAMDFPLLDKTFTAASDAVGVATSAAEAPSPVPDK